MERWVKTGSGFRAQGAAERKDPNRNPDVTDWFYSLRYTEICKVFLKGCGHCSDMFVMFLTVLQSLNFLEY